MKNKLLKIKQFIIKNILGMIIGGVIVGSITIATANYAFEGSNVYYDKSSSGGSYNNVQDSISELYEKIGNGKKVEVVEKVSLEPSSEYCNQFTYGKWVSLTNAKEGFCSFKGTLDKDYGKKANCYGSFYGNYSDSGTNGDQWTASFRWGSGAPYAYYLELAGTDGGGAGFGNSLSLKSYTDLIYKCAIDGDKIDVFFYATKQTSTSWDYASYGWQTRANWFYFDGLIVYE